MKQRGYTVLVICGFLLSAYAGHAQGTSSVAGVELQLLEQLSGTRSVPALPAPTGGSLLNLTQLTQQGSLNAAHITQVGSGNITSITQVGTSNVAVSTITGTGTRSDIVQTGAHNVVEQQLSVDQRRYTVLQQGLNNQLRQVESGATAPAGYEVKMVGQGINMTIQQGQSTYRP